MDHQQDQINKDVLIQKKEELYFLYSTSHNCVVSNENFEEAYKQLLERIDIINQKKEEAGIVDEPFSSDYPQNKSRVRVLVELGLFLSKCLILGIILIFALQIILTTILGFQYLGLVLFPTKNQPFSMKSPLPVTIHSLEEAANSRQAAVDGSTVPHSFWETLKGYPVTFEFENSSGQKVSGYFLQVGELATRMPVSWRFQFFNGEKWVDLDTRKWQINWKPTELRAYPLEFPTKEGRFRFVFDEGPSVLRIYELGIF